MLFGFLFKLLFFQVNGRPLELIEPRALQFKLQEPILLLGKERFADIDMRIRVKVGFFLCNESIC